MFTVNGKELNYDIFDADLAERYEQALNTVTKQMEELQKQGDRMTYSQVLRAQCEAVAKCFDTLFGDGCAANLFDGTVNLKTALLAFEELVVGINEEKREIEAIAQKAALKTRGNRAQRRAKK